MRKLAVVLFLCAASVVGAWGSGYGYGFVGVPDPVRGGIGFEYGGTLLKFGGEIGSLNRNAALFSGNLGFHFPAGRVDPFLTGDPSLFLNVGGGVNYWWKQRFGLRGEIRPHIHLAGDRSTFTEFRFGVVFR